MADDISDRLARASRALEDARRSTADRKSLVMARAAARELVDELDASDGRRLEALRIVQASWQLEMNALAGLGELYERAFRSAADVQHEVLAETSREFGEVSLAMADALADAGELYMEHADLLETVPGATGPPPAGPRSRAHEYLRRALELYERLGDGDGEGAEDVRELLGMG